MWPWRTSSSWQKHFLSSRSTCLRISIDWAHLRSVLMRHRRLAVNLKCQAIASRFSRILPFALRKGPPRNASFEVCTFVLKMVKMGGGQSLRCDRWKLLRQFPSRPVLNALHYHIFDQAGISTQSINGSVFI
jgi:hypothetical protein